MTKYALFLGCTIPARQLSYELSARKVLTKLGIELVDLPDMTCCAPPPVESINVEAGMSTAAYNICLAEEADLNIVTLCAGCFQSLAKTNALLKKDGYLKTRINNILSHTGKEFTGKIDIRHFIQVLRDDFGLEGIRKAVSKPLDNLKIAAFYGCHVLRPSELLMFDDPEKPRLLDDLIEVIGAKSIDYKNKLKCCGGLLRGFSDDLALDLAREKLMNSIKARVDCVTTICPFCFVALDIGQIQIRSKFKENYELPILHFSELLALALGIDPEELAFKRTHKIKVDKIIEKIT
jgi:heterodisulfide reductase subunit B